MAEEHLVLIQTQGLLQVSRGQAGLSAVLACLRRMRESAPLRGIFALLLFRMMSEEKFAWENL